MATAMLDQPRTQEPATAVPEPSRCPIAALKRTRTLAAGGDEGLPCGSPTGVCSPSGHPDCTVC